MTTDRYFTSQQVAQALGISPASLRRWCDEGRLNSVKTAGGHRRFTEHQVQAFVDSSGMPLRHPEVLGFEGPFSLSPGYPQSSTGTASELAVPEISLANPAEQRLAYVDGVYQAIVEGRTPQVRKVFHRLIAQKWSVDRLADEIIQPVMERIGQQWGCGRIEVYQERRACEILVGLLHEHRTNLSQGELQGPVAIGATILDDNYELPIALVELLLIERGWQAQSLGTQLPPSTFAAAVLELRPKLAWLSASVVNEPRSFVQGFGQLADAAKRAGTLLVVGGRGINPNIKQVLPAAFFCDHLWQFSEVAARFWSSP